MSDLKMYAEETLRTAKRTCDEFAKSFAQGPAYAFSWGERAVKAAAQVQVMSEVVILSEKLTDDQIIERFTDQMIRKAASPASSTSQLSNLMETQINAVVADMIERARRQKEFPKKG